MNRINRIACAAVCSWLAATFVTSMSAIAVAADRTTSQIPSCLTATLGKRVIVDIPDTKDLGQPLKTPAGWVTVQATGETVKELLAYAGARFSPFVAYLDEHGNVVHFDDSDKCRATVSAGARESERRIEVMKKALATQWHDAEKARERNAEARELILVRELLERGVRGYPQIDAAVLRLAEIERDRRVRFAKIMAHEGLISKRQLETQLAQLLESSAGCAIEASLRRQLYWLEKSLVVAPRS
ncbi:MAG: hypothetical protein ACKVX7_03885 [Planctomycetota bacterium]